MPTIDNATPGLARAWSAVATAREVACDEFDAWLLGECWTLQRRGDELVCEPQPWGVCERYGLIWIAPEEPLCDLHEFTEWDDPRFDTAMSTMIRTPVGAAQLVDNFLDAAHFPFVHAATFGVDESAVVSDRGTRRDGWCVETTFDTWYRTSDEVQPQTLMKRASASLSVLLRLHFPTTGSTISILFSCTPERADTTRVYKLLARDDLHGDQDRISAFIAEEDQILEEDLAILGRYRHRSVPLDRTVEVHTRADRLSLAWRELVADAFFAPAFAP